MHGMIAGYLTFKRDECLDAAVNAGKWMLSQQDDDGCWRRSVHNDTLILIIRVQHGHYCERVLSPMKKIGECSD